MDCTIEPKSTQLFIQPTTASTWSTPATASTATGTQPFLLTSSACVPNLMFATSRLYGPSSLSVSGNLAFSESYFLVLAQTVLTRAFDVDSSGVQRVVIVSESQVVVLSVSGVVHTISMGVAGSVLATGVVAGDGVTELRAAEICSTQKGNLNGHVVAWKQVVGVTVVFYSVDAGVTFSSVDVAAQMATAGTSKIWDVVLSQQLRKYVILVRDGSGVDRVVLFDPVSGKLGTGYVFGAVGAKLISSVTGVSPTITEGSGSMLFSGDALYSSPDFGQTMFPITLQSRNPANPAPGLAIAEWVAQTCISQDGSAFAVLTSNNRVFYGHTGISTAIEIAAGLSLTTAAKLGFDGMQRLVVYTPLGSVSYVTSRILSIPNEVLSPRAPVVTNPTLVCPYESWSTDLKAEYTVDMGESITITTTVTSSNSISKDILISYSNYSILSLSTTTAFYTATDLYSPSSNLISLQTTTTISPTSNTLSGASQLSLHPRAASLACLSPPSFASSTLTIGCPSTRRIVFRPPTLNESSLVKGQPYPSLTQDCSTAPTSVFLPAGQSTDFSITPPSTHHTDTYISYNCATYGLPIPAFYGSPFTPVLDVVDDGVWVKRVDADYGVWEVNGRTGFGYNLTVGEVGCVSGAQSWVGVVEQGGGRVAVDAWGPANYVSCFGTGGGPLHPADEYTIFNPKNELGIVWTGGMDGIYMFTAKVLDLEFSYCSLTASFAVSVYGAPVPPGAQAGIIVGLAVLLGACLAGSYYWYLRERRKEALASELQEDGEGGEDGETEEEEEMLWKEKLE
ncbi:hypothetical protein HDU98_008187 [Podochytrium sp. JEL0797]|nr:hypothetical protein HDU98_008187 [Podochytrium sp. JEL0797]